MHKISTRVVCVKVKHRKNTGTPRTVHVEICQVNKTNRKNRVFRGLFRSSWFDKMPRQTSSRGKAWIFQRGEGGRAQCVTPMVITCTCRHPRDVLLKVTLFRMSSERGEGNSVQNSWKDELRGEKDLQWLLLKWKILVSITPWICLFTKGRN